MNEPKILVVDDIYLNQFLIQAAFEEVGLKAKAVNNGKKAIDEILNTNYDIVFMDIEMPVMNGIEAVKYIREKMDDTKKNVPVIALTAHNYYDAATNLNNIGFNEVVYKPYNIDKLLNIIEKYTNYKKS